MASVEGKRNLKAPDFGLIFDATPGLYLVLLPDDPTFTIVAVNAEYARATLTKPDQIIGRGLFEVFPDNPTDQDASGVRNLHASLREILTTKTRHTMPAQKYDIRRPDSAGGGFEERYWSPVNSPVLGGNGEVQFIIHRVEDITELVRLKRQETEQVKLADELRLRADKMEAELFLRGRQLAESQRLMREREQVEEKLLASEARFSLAFAEAPIGMVLLTPEGRIVEANQAFLDTLGYTRDEIISGDSSRFTHPEDVDVTRKFFESLREGPHNTASFEKRYFRKDGKLLWSRASGTMRRDAQGRPAQVIAIVEDITERKLAQERLWESQEQLRAIYDGTYEYIGLVAPDGTVLDCNRASLEFAGNSREQVIGLPIWETPWFALTPGASETVRDGVARASAGEFVRYEAPLIRPSGAVLTFDFSLHPVRNERGEVVSLVPEGRNITDRKEAEVRDALLVGLDDAMRPLTDAQEITRTAARMLGEHLRVNRCTYADVEEDENTVNLTGDYTREVPSAAGRYLLSQFGAECQRALREGKAYVVEDSEADPRAAGAIDSYRLAQIRSCICVPLLTGRRLAATLAVHQTTPRHWGQNEIELVQLVGSRCWESIERVHVARELREREQRFRFLAESIPQMVWTATPDGMFDYMNGQGASYFGVPQDALLGAGWLQGLHPEDRERTVERWKHSVATGEPYESAYRLRRGDDGSWRWHLVRALPLVGEDGSVLQWFGTCTDTNDQRTTEEELRRTNRELEEFAYVASHDLQEPLRMVNIYTQMILKNVGPVDETLSQYAGFVRQGVSQMEALIHDLLTFSRTVQSDEPHAGEADLSAAFNDALSLLKKLIEETGAIIRTEPLPLARGDTSQMVHVFQNVLSNALKYRKAEAPPEIQVSAERRRHQWLVSIQDNGIGFEPRYSQRIFGLFKRLHKNEYPGTGIGLAICKRIVERYGGRIWAEGRPGDGATFYFTLPRLDSK